MFNLRRLFSLIGFLPFFKRKKVFASLVSTHFALSEYYIKTKIVVVFL